MAEKPSPTDLAQRTIHRRAMEAITWGIGAVNFDLMFQAFVNAKGVGNGPRLPRILRQEQEYPDGDFQSRY